MVSYTRVIKKPCLQRPLLHAVECVSPEHSLSASNKHFLVMTCWVSSADIYVCMYIYIYIAAMYTSMGSLGKLISNNNLAAFGRGGGADFRKVNRDMFDAP